jgi:hypothetical protein
MLWRNSGCGGYAISTILSVIGVDLDTSIPCQQWKGHAVPGGYSARREPIIANGESASARHSQGITISGIGGENSHDALEFSYSVLPRFNLHRRDASSVKMVDELKEGVEKFMTDKRI